MNFPRPVRLVLALLSGLFLAFAFPNFDCSICAWFAVALLLLAAMGASAREAALYGVLHALVFYSISLSWIQTVIRQYGDVDAFTPVVLLGMIVLAESVFYLIFTVLVARWSRASPGRACFFAPFLWVAMDLAKTHLPYIEFPWNSIGYAISGQLALVQLAAWTGVYGLSFLVVAFNALLAWMIVRPERRTFLAALCAAAGLILAALLGPHFVPRPVPHHIAHLIQTNFEQAMTHPPNWLEVHAPDLDELEKLSISSARGSPGLIIWPEVPAPFSLQDRNFAVLAQRIAREGGQDFLVGVDDWRPGPQKEMLVSNSAVLLNPAGQRIFTYDKMHLVPFSEYVPLRRWIPFAQQLIAEIGDFTPGNEHRVGTIPGGSFGVFICYESIFPGEIRQFAAHGAELLITVSNDGWFGRSAAPAQHLLMVRVRAVENRRWLLRDTNNGYTVSLDPYGRIVAEMPTDVRGQLDAPYDFRTDRSLYSRWGDWWAWLCVCVGMIGIFDRRKSSMTTRGS